MKASLVLTVPALALSVSSEPVRRLDATRAKRDLATLTSVAAQIEAAIVSLDDSVKPFANDDDGVQVIANADTLAKVIQEGTSKIRDIGRIFLADDLGVAGILASLQAKGQTLLSDVEAKKTQFEETRLCRLAETRMQRINAMSAELIDAVMAGLPSVARDVVREGTSGLSDILAQGAAFFSTDNCRNRVVDATAPVVTGGTTFSVLPLPPCSTAPASPELPSSEASTFPAIMPPASDASAFPTNPVPTEAATSLVGRQSRPEERTGSAPTLDSSSSSTTPTTTKPLTVAPSSTLVVVPATAEASETSLLLVAPTPTGGPHYGTTEPAGVGSTSFYPTSTPSSPPIPTAAAAVNAAGPVGVVAGLIAALLLCDHWMLGVTHPPYIKVEVPQVVVKSWQRLTVEQSKLDVGLVVVLTLPLVVVVPVGAAVEPLVLGVVEGGDGGMIVGSPGVGLHGVCFGHRVVLHRGKHVWYTAPQSSTPSAQTVLQLGGGLDVEVVTGDVFLVVARVVVETGHLGGFGDSSGLHTS
ncbi:hypothetical protein DL765_001089 [Monosporascus sp. GIB2]|nr:hypothetical protein DL765_001089 [Monosporascus sp. GIB2]